MKAYEFCYWLQGLFELGEVEALSPRQVEVIRQHLNMVFVHDIDPSYPAGHQKPLNKIHNGLPPVPPIGSMLSYTSP